MVRDQKELWKIVLFREVGASMRPDHWTFCAFQGTNSIPKGRSSPLIVSEDCRTRSNGLKSRERKGMG